MPRTRRVAACGLLVLLVVACGDGVAPVDTVTLGIIEPGVDVADVPDEGQVATFRTGEDGEGLVVGDVVRTDPVGFAEVVWSTGALARVDVDTVFAVTELATAADQPVVRTRLDVGRVWNRLGAGADYRLATDVGTAAVRGTAFDVACGLDCTFRVVEGVVTVATVADLVVEVRAGEQVTIGPDGVPGPVAPVELDAWVRDNLARDVAAGFTEVAVDDLAADAPGRGGTTGVITFETLGGATPTEGQRVTDQYQDEFGITFSVEGGGAPTIAMVGSPIAAFGNAVDGDDTPAAGPAAGSYFLTDDGSLTTDGSPPGLVLTLDPATDYVAGDIYDIDGQESFELQALDGDGRVLATRSFASGDPGTGEGVASRWVFEVGSPTIVQVVIRGFRPGGQFGFGFDNIRTRAP